MTDNSINDHLIAMNFNKLLVQEVMLEVQTQLSDYEELMDYTGGASGQPIRPGPLTF